MIVLITEISSDTGSLEVQINALSKDSTLVVPEDARGNVLQPGSGIILEEVAAKRLGVKVGDEVSIGDTKLKVSGIAREIVNSIQYILQNRRGTSLRLISTVSLRPTAAIPLLRKKTSSLWFP